MEFVLPVEKLKLGAEIGSSDSNKTINTAHQKINLYVLSDTINRL
jgi:hypothetical protein